MPARAEPPNSARPPKQWQRTRRPARILGCGPDDLASENTIKVYAWYGIGLPGIRAGRGQEPAQMAGRLACARHATVLTLLRDQRHHRAGEERAMITAGNQQFNSQSRSTK